MLVVLASLACALVGVGGISARSGTKVEESAFTMKIKARTSECVHWEVC